LAIEESEIIEQQVKAEVEIQFPYASMNEVMKMVKTYELQILSQEMHLDCKMKLEFREGIKETILSGLTEVKGLDLISS
jgi:putative IMPACT (imprinted ancient) family translation regulator